MVRNAKYRVTWNWKLEKCDTYVLARWTKIFHEDFRTCKIPLTNQKEIWWLTFRAYLGWENRSRKNHKGNVFSNAMIWIKKYIFSAIGTDVNIYSSRNNQTNCCLQIKNKYYQANHCHRRNQNECTRSTKIYWITSILTNRHDKEAAEYRCSIAKGFGI